MAPKRRRFAVLLGSLLLAASIITVPALAEEDSGLVPYSQNGDGPIFFPTPVAPPTPTPEPTPTPTPEPTPPPTPTPTPTSSPTDTPDDNPDDNNNNNNNNNNNGGDNNNYATPKPNGTGTVTPAPTPHPSNRPIPTEQPSVNRPKVTPKPQIPTDPSQTTASDDGTNYVTFAQLNVKNNSLAVALFYGGLACAVLGGAGLIFLLVRALKNRRKDEKAAIFQEIEEAENRQHPVRVPSSTPELMISPPGASSGHASRPPHPAQPYAHPHQTPAARQTAPQTHPSRPPSHGEEVPVPSHSHGEGLSHGDLPSHRPQTGAAAPIVPVHASYYTEEFSLEEERNTNTAVTASSPSAAPAAAVPSLASRLRAQRAARIVQNDHLDAASRPELHPTGKPLAESLNREPAQPEPAKEERPIEPPATPQVPEKAQEQPVQQPPVTQQPTAPPEQEQKPAEQKAEPPADKVPANTKISEDPPEQLTFQQPEKEAQPDAAEKKPEKDASSDEQLPGQISFL